MRDLRRVFFVPLALLAAVSASASVPEKAWGKGVLGQDAPLWVSEDLAVVDTQLQKQHFHPDVLTLVEQSIEGSGSRNARGCEIYTETAVPPAREGAHTPRPEGAFNGTTAASIRANAAQLLSGTITDLKQGFLSGQPGTMLEIAVDSRKRHLGAQHLYVFLRIADIPLEGTHLCTGLTDGRPVPTVGASIVLALGRVLNERRILGRTDDGAPIVEPQPNEVLISGALPKAYEHSKIDVDGLRDQVRKEGGRR